MDDCIGAAVAEAIPTGSEHANGWEAATGWALRAAAGDESAVVAFVRATQVPVWRFVAGLVDRHVADDLTQETYLRAFRALAEFRGESGARTWLLSIARRVCADHLRTLVRHRRLSDRLSALPATGPVPADPAGTVASHDLLDHLPTDQRSAFVLTQLLGLSYEQAAAVERVPLGTIRSRVARARDRLVHALDGAAAC